MPTSPTPSPPDWPSSFYCGFTHLRVPRSRTNHLTVKEAQIRFLIVRWLGEGGRRNYSALEEELFTTSIMLQICGGCLKIVLANSGFTQSLANNFPIAQYSNCCAAEHLSSFFDREGRRGRERFLTTPEWLASRAAATATRSDASASKYEPG